MIKYCQYLFLLILISGCNEKKKVQKPPNFIVILVDDLGYNDLGCYNSKDQNIQTPNIDKLASDGIRFTDWQSANSVCGPSRAALLTGRYPPRNGYVVVSHPFDKEQYDHLGLYQDEVTIAEMLKTKGYTTGAIGKWHMGEHYDYRPMRHGFDHYFGKLHNFNRFKKGSGIYEQDNLTKDSVHYENMHELVTNKAKEFINKANEKETPFFMYLSHYLVHGPWKQNKRFTTNKEWNTRLEKQGDINPIVYPAMVRELDWHIGEIVKELEKLGMTENTVIFFTSDNGPWLTNNPDRSAGSAWPLRGSKFNTFEGGHRVPGIVKYPKRIPSGLISNELVSSMDIFPTIAHLSGASLPEDKIIDGKNIWPLLSGKKNAKSPHHVLYAYQGENLQTIRKGSWKLHLPRKSNEMPFYGQKQWGKGTIDNLKQPLLFNLETDIKESKDLSSEFPEIVNDLLEEANKARVELGDWDIVGNDQHDFNSFEGNVHAKPIRK